MRCTRRTIFRHVFHYLSKLESLPRYSNLFANSNRKNVKQKAGHLEKLYVSAIYNLSSTSSCHYGFMCRIHGLLSPSCGVLRTANTRLQLNFAVLSNSQRVMCAYRIRQWGSSFGGQHNSDNYPSCFQLFSTNLHQSDWSRHIPWNGESRWYWFGIRFTISLVFSISQTKICCIFVGSFSLLPLCLSIYVLTAALDYLPPISAVAMLSNMTSEHIVGLQLTSTDVTNDTCSQLLSNLA